MMVCLYRHLATVLQKGELISLNYGIYSVLVEHANCLMPIVETAVKHEVS